MSRAIVFEKVSKVFPGVPVPAVNDASFEVMEGHLVVLLGSSGSGKTTLMKMVNRLYEPTSGRILIGDKSVQELSLTQLRRGIGYVIQQVGLFPHMKVAKNIAVVPDMLGWDKERTSKRTDELLELVGLPPVEYRDRYPAQLSGGQQQRVGLARALAADPPVMLMDEPFAAIDNITRTRLQDELLRVQQSVRKTILFVTHDVEEALKLADEIVVMDKGHVLQYDTPLNILCNPADEFVANLMGADDVLRRLRLQTVASVMTEAPLSLRLNDEYKLQPGMSLRDALGQLLSSGKEELPVVSPEGQLIGRVTLNDIRNETKNPVTNRR